MKSFSKIRRTQTDIAASSDSAESQEAERPALTEIYCGETPVVDIVAIHGINGDALHTFTAKGQHGPWLGQPGLLPSDLPNCRVLTFSYHADVATVLGRTSSDRILQHAHTLIAELVANREYKEAIERPIIFICHSLGGIIAKRALVYSASRTSHRIQHLHSIYVSTYGILFFGTPHLGSSVADLASYAQRLVQAVAPSKIVDTSPQLLNTLREGSEVLQDITDNFVPLMKRYRICFFWEQEKTDLKVKFDYIVPESSAAPILDGTERAGLRYDHRNMCKFASTNSPGYMLVVSILRRYSRDASGTVSSRWKAEKDILRAMRMNEAAELRE